MIARLISVPILLATAGVAWADHWSVTSQDVGVTVYDCVSENFLLTGPPWDSDGEPACPPKGDDDVRCEWQTDHTGGATLHERNGVIAAVLDGAASQGAVMLGDEWSDLENTGSTWWVNYDVHFVAIDPGDIPDLRATMRFQHAGVTRLTLNLIGQAGGSRVQYRVAPTHFWTETPETGSQWRIELTLRRTQPGSMATIWVDNILVTEGAVTLYEEEFSLEPADANCDGSIDSEDIDPFFTAVGNPAVYLATYADCDLLRSDINLDGAVDAEDIDPFFECVGIGSCP